MSFLRTRYLYMPPGSFTILPDETVYFPESTPQDLQERFLQEFQENKEKFLRGEIKDYLP